MKKIITGFIAIVFAIISPISVFAKDSDYYDYKYRTESIVREYVDESDNLLLRFRFKFYFRFNEGLNQAKCLAIDEEKLYLADRFNAKANVCLQNMRTDLGGAMVELKLNYDDFSEESIKFRVYMDSKGNFNVVDIRSTQLS